MSVWLAALYTYGCPELSKKEEKKIFKFVKNPKRGKEAVKILAKLEPWIWYQVIGKKNKSFFLSHKVIEAYWLGSEDLDLEFRGEDLEFLLASRGQEPARLACAFKGQMVKKKGSFLLHHNLTETILLTKTSLFEREEFVNSCLIRSGEIISLKKDYFLVETFWLSEKVKKREEEIKNLFGVEAREGEFVTFHFGIARQKVPFRVHQRLIKITEQILKGE